MATPAKGTHNKRNIDMTGQEEAQELRIAEEIEAMSAWEASENRRACDDLLNSLLPTHYEETNQG